MKRENESMLDKTLPPSGDGNERMTELERARGLLRAASEQVLNEKEEAILKAIKAPLSPSPEPVAEAVPPEMAAPEQPAATVEAGPFKFVFPRLGKDKSIRYQSPDGSVYEITKPEKSSGGSQYRITKQGDSTIATISRTGIIERGQAEEWKLVSENTPVQTSPSQPAEVALGATPAQSVSRPGESRQALPYEVEQHLLALRKGQTLRYSNIDGDLFVISRVGDQETFQVLSPDGTIRLHHVREMVSIIQEHHWRFRGKSKPVADIEPTSAPANEKNGQETPGKIEKRLTGLKDSRALVYEDTAGSLFTITNGKKKNPEVELDYDLRPMAMGDTKVFMLTRSDGTSISMNFRELVKEISDGEWRFRRTQDISRQSVAPAPEQHSGSAGVAVPASGLTPPPTAPEAVAPKSPEHRAELGLSVGEIWSATEEGHDVDIEILEFFDGPAKEGNARMVRIRRTMAGPRRSEDIRMEIPLYKLAERLKSYTKKREAPKPVERIDPSLESSALPLEAAAVAASAAVQAEAGDLAPGAENPVSSRPAAEGHPSEETVRSVEAGGMATPDNTSPVSDIDKEVAKLREEVASERAAFIAVEESQRSAWKNLTRIFRGLSHKDSDDAEVARYRAFYDEKVLALQNAELEKLKRSGKTVKELRPEMAALIREFEFDEAERIYTARQEMRLAKTNQPLLEKMKALWVEAEEGINGPTAKGEVKAWIKLFAGGTIIAGEGALRTLETVGKFSNKISRGKAGKYVLTATVTVGGAVALGAATGGVASVAIGALALKRLAAGAGLAVAAEAGMNQYAKYRREKRRTNVEQDHEARFDAMESEEDLEIKLGNKQEINFSKLEKYLKEVSAQTRKGEGARRRNDFLRKSGAIFAGAVLGSGAAAHFANGYIGSGSKAHAASLLGSEANIPTGGPGSGPPMAESLVTAESSKATPVIPVPSNEGVAEALKDTRAIPVPAEGVEGSAKELLGSYEVKRGESIWKLATRAVQDVPGMDERTSGRFAKLVELRLTEKLESNPGLARAAGFVADADGKFSPQHIRAGTKLELGKLLSQDELAKLLEEAKSKSPISAPSIAVPDTPIREIVSPTPALSEAEIIAQDEVRVAKRILPISADERAAIVATFPESPTTELIKPGGNVMKYIESLPKEDQEKLFRDFKKISVELFQTNEVMGGEVYDMRYDPVVHPELAKTRFTAVIADHKLLAKNPFVGYDRLRNPLHWSQMEEVSKFAKASAKAFGDSVAQPKTAESVQEYTLRMIAIARNQDVKIPGFRVLD